MSWDFQRRARLGRPSSATRIRRRLGRFSGAHGRKRDKSTEPPTTLFLVAQDKPQAAGGKSAAATNAAELTGRSTQILNGGMHGPREQHRRLDKLLRSSAVSSNCSLGSFAMYYNRKCLRIGGNLLRCKGGTTNLLGDRVGGGGS